VVAVLAIGVVLVEGDVGLIDLQLAYLGLKSLDALLLVLELHCEVLQLNLQLPHLTIPASTRLPTKQEPMHPREE
jgi:hypothetical protein